jgi:hypothetical protein
MIWSLILNEIAVFILTENTLTNESSPQYLNISDLNSAKKILKHLVNFLISVEYHLNEEITCDEETVFKF